MRQSIHWRVLKMYRWTNWGTWPVSPHVKESKTVLDSGFHAVDSWSRSDTEFWIINFLPVELRFRIPIVSGIPDSLGCIPGCPTSKNFPDSGIRISLQGHTASGNQCSAFLNTPIGLQIISLWHDVKFIDWDPHWDSSRVKEAIRIRSLYPNNINRDDRIVDAYDFLTAPYSRSLPWSAGQLREQSLILTIPAKHLIELPIKHDRVKSTVHHLQRPTVLLTVPLGKSIPSPEKGQLRAINDKVERRDYRETNDN